MFGKKKKDKIRRPWQNDRGPRNTLKSVERQQRDLGAWGGWGGTTGKRREDYEDD